MKKILAAAVLTASLPLLPAPADAASSKDWVRLEFPCRDGKGTAVLGYSPTHPMWLDGPDDEAVRNPKAWANYYTNPCKGQWLVTGVWGGEQSPASTTLYNVGTGKSGRMLGQPWARLLDAPDCGWGTNNVVIVAKREQARTACAEQQ